MLLLVFVWLGFWVDLDFKGFDFCCLLFLRIIEEVIGGGGLVNSVLGGLVFSFEVELIELVCLF